MSSNRYGNESQRSVSGSSPRETSRSPSRPERPVSPDRSLRGYQVEFPRVARGNSSLVASNGPLATTSIIAPTGQEDTRATLDYSRRHSTANQDALQDRSRRGSTANRDTLPSQDRRSSSPQHTSARRNSTVLNSTWNPNMRDMEANDHFGNISSIGLPTEPEAGPHFGGVQSGSFRFDQNPQVQSSKHQRPPTGATSGARRDSYSNNRNAFESPLEKSFGASKNASSVGSRNAAFESRSSADSDRYVVSGVKMNSLTADDMIPTSCMNNNCGNRKASIASRNPSGGKQNPFNTSVNKTADDGNRSSANRNNVLNTSANRANLVGNTSAGNRNTFNDSMNKPVSNVNRSFNTNNLNASANRANVDGNSSAGNRNTFNESMNKPLSNVNRSFNTNNLNASANRANLVGNTSAGNRNSFNDSMNKIMSDVNRSFNMNNLNTGTSTNRIENVVGNTAGGNLNSLNDSMNKLMSDMNKSLNMNNLNTSTNRGNVVGNTSGGNLNSLNDSVNKLMSDINRSINTNNLNMSLNKLVANRNASGAGMYPAGAQVNSMSPYGNHNFVLPDPNSPYTSDVNAYTPTTISNTSSSYYNNNELVSPGVALPLIPQLDLDIPGNFSISITTNNSTSSSIAQEMDKALSLTEVLEREDMLKKLQHMQHARREYMFASLPDITETGQYTYSESVGFASLPDLTEFNGDVSPSNWPEDGYEDYQETDEYDSNDPDPEFDYCSYLEDFNSENNNNYDPNGSDYYVIKGVNRPQHPTK